MKRLIASSILGGALLLGTALSAFADSSNAAVGFGTLFYNGGTIHTVIPPAAFPNSGTDPFYKLTTGAAGQLGIAGVAPGTADYHGGAWAVNLVTFNAGVTPYLLTSAAAVQAAAAAGDVTLTRVPDQDFRCPVQP
ncbi:MAG: hypothetical protein E6I86_08715 [Chloroflexi bacterium]|nr:MAG: hypothetical protein E6I86_08715 [Chloroflexota bacterium]